jgi:hypothetical protein
MSTVIGVKQKGIEPLAAGQIGLLLAELFDGIGLSVSERDGRLVAVGVSQTAARAPLAE